MYFYSASSKEGSWEFILLISLVDDVITLMDKLEFEATNNITGYEALVLGLRESK